MFDPGAPCDNGCCKKVGRFAVERGDVVATEAQCRQCIVVDRTGEEERMLLMLAAGGSIIAAATQWVREHPGRIEEEFKAIYREAYLELQETATTESPERGSEPVRQGLEALEVRYQQFMVQKVDPLLSRTRRDQLAEMTSGEVVTLTDHERGSIATLVRRWLPWVQQPSASPIRRFLS